jgi:hypothetical protein
MKEILFAYVPTPELVAGATHLVTMGCGEACPVAPPSVRRDEIRDRVLDLVTTER